MPAGIAWMDEAHTVLLQTVRGVYTIREYQQMVAETTEWLRQEDHVVHIISDFREAGPTPKDALNGALYAEKRRATNQGVVVFVGANALLQAFINVSQKAGLKIAQNIHSTATLDEAFAIIAEQGANLGARR